MTTKKDIVIALEELGIKEGDVILVHSSLSSIGEVFGGADALIEAFLDAIGSNGTLLMPAFTDDVSMPFDVISTPSDVGIITEVFRRRKDVFRSLHPTHSVCAYGKYAEETVMNHHLSSSACGNDSPFLKIRDLKGKIILLGVDMNRNTMLHAVEEAAGVPYLIEGFEVSAPTYMDNYLDRKIIVEHMPLGHRDFLKLTPILREMEIIKEAFIGLATIKVMDVKKLFDATLNILKKNPGYFLCSNIYCNSCMTAKSKITATNFVKINKENRCKWNNCEICSV